MEIGAVWQALTRDYPPDARYTVHAQQRYRLVFAQAGGAALHFGQQEQRVCAGEVFLLQPGEGYTVTVGQDGYRFITAPFTARCDAALPRMLLQDMSLLPLFSEMDAVSLARRPGWQMELRRRIYAVLCRYASETQCYDAGKKTRPALERMRAGYASRLTQQMLAQSVGYSVPHFKRLFTQENGVPPIRWLNELRVERAKALLDSGLYRVGEVAAACGFESAYYFSSVFKKISGQTPTEYLRAAAPPQKNRPSN